MFHSLFQAGKIGRLELKNRLIMAAMGNALAGSEGAVNEAMLDYYRPRGRGGVGLVITQFAAVSPEAVMPYNLRLDDDRYIPGISRLVQMLHGCGVKVAVQLMHPGLLLTLLKSASGDQPIMVPSLSSLLSPERKYRELNPAEIERCIEEFMLAAVRAQSSGADVLELHACHGCLLSTFLSPAVNRRGDQYGGSRENRARLVSRIIDGIKGRLGADFPLIVRINGDDDVAGGVSPEDVAGYAAIFAGAGADAISVSSGMEYWSTLMAPTHLTPPGPVIGVAARLKDNLHIPVIVAGKIPPALAAKSLSAGKADFIALGRPLLADPALPDKLLQGKLNDIAWCLYCNNCMRTSWSSCSVNPTLYREALFQPKAAETPKKVVVIGGGLAGMEAALLCREKGHEVYLCERENALGGQWRTACALPGKGGYRSLLNSLKRKMERAGVRIVLGGEMNVASVAALKPDIAIVATGAVSLTASFPGFAGLNALQASDLLLGKAPTRGKVLVLGGTVLAMETALLIAQEGGDVALVSPTGLGGKKGPDEMITFRALLRRLAEKGVPIYANASPLEFSGGVLLVRWGEENLPLRCDTLVQALGVKADDRLSAELEKSVPAVYSIGDCVVPGTAAQAMFSAARLAQKL